MKENINFKEISIHNTPDCSLGFLLWSVSTSWRGSIESVLKSIDLTHPQFVILASLGWLTRKGDRINQAIVGKMVRLDPNTVSQIIKGLEKKEFITREKSSDGRAKNPILTTKGLDILKKAIPIVENKDVEFFYNLTKEEREFIIGIFHKLISK